MVVATDFPLLSVDVNVPVTFERTKRPSSPRRTDEAVELTAWIGAWDSGAIRDHCGLVCLERHVHLDSEYLRSPRTCRSE